MAESDPPPPTKRRSSLLRPRFSVGTLMLAMVVCCVLGAGIYYGLQAVDAGFQFEGMLVIAAVCAPPLLLLTTKLAYLLLQWINRDRDDS